MALLHTIVRLVPPGLTSPWLNKWNFPHGNSPALSEVIWLVEDLRMETCDVEVWRLHYAETLRHWHDRFMARADDAEPPLRRCGRADGARGRVRLRSEAQKGRVTSPT